MQASRDRIPFGLLELDTSDIVVFYDPAPACADGEIIKSIVGRNLFTDVLVFPESNSLQRIVEAFRQSPVQFQSFPHCFSDEAEVQSVIILLAQKPDQDRVSPITLLQIIDTSSER